MRGILPRDGFQLINRRTDTSRLLPSCNPWWITTSMQSPSGVGNSMWQEERVLDIAPQAHLQADLPPKRTTSESESDLGFAIQPPTYRRQRLRNMLNASREMLSGRTRPWGPLQHKWPRSFHKILQEEREREREQTSPKISKGIWKTYQMPTNDLCAFQGQWCSTGKK